MRGMLGGVHLESWWDFRSTNGPWLDDANLRPRAHLPRADRPLTAEPEAEARRLDHHLPKAGADAQLPRARRLASLPHPQLRGAPACELRERGFPSGAPAVETARDERNKGATRTPAPLAPRQRSRPVPTLANADPRESLRDGPLPAALLPRSPGVRSLRSAAEADRPGPASGRRAVGRPGRGTAPLRRGRRERAAAAGPRAAGPRLAAAGPAGPTGARPRRGPGPRMRRARRSLPYVPRRPAGAPRPRRAKAAGRRAPVGRVDPPVPEERARRARPRGPRPAGPARSRARWEPVSTGGSRGGTGGAAPERCGKRIGSWWAASSLRCTGGTTRVTGRRVGRAAAVPWRVRARR